MERLETTTMYEVTSPVMEDDEGVLLSLDGRRMFEIVNCVFLSTAIGMFGVVANAVNIAIFFKQGLGNTVNISLFGMAISDLCSLITLIWLNTCLNPLFENSGVPWVTSEIQYLTAGWPHVCFTRITCCITTFVTAERCLCITVPLKVRQIITPTRTKIAICAIYILMILSLVPEYATTYLDWRFYPPKNMTMLRLVFTRHRSKVEGAVFILNATLALMSFIGVSVCTVILVWKLKSVAKWRKESTHENEQSESICVRDKKTMNMIVIIAGILVICYTPGTVLLLLTFFHPEFNITGKYVNIFLAAWSFGLLFESINASVNIFLYYKMSTRYRETFHQLMFKCKKRRSAPAVPESGSEKSNTNTTLKLSYERSDSEIVLDESLDLQQVRISRISMPAGTSPGRTCGNGPWVGSGGTRQVKLTPKFRDKLYHGRSIPGVSREHVSAAHPLMFD